MMNSKELIEHYHSILGERRVEQIRKSLPPRLHSLTPIQVGMYNDLAHRFIACSAGRRARKSRLFTRKVAVQHALVNPGHVYRHAAPTRIQAKDIFWERLKEEYYPFIKDKSDSELKIKLYNDTVVQVVGLEKGQRIEGTEVHGWHITEYADVKPDIYKLHVRPTVADTRGFVYFDGVPEGRNHYYDLVKKICNGVIPKTVEIEGAYCEDINRPDWAWYSWFSKDVLTADEWESILNEDIDEKTLRQEYFGDFVEAEGMCYYSFSDKNLKRIKYNPDETVHVGMDFNVRPMTAVMCHVRGDELFQFGEAYFQNSNTGEMINHLNSHFKIGNMSEELKKRRFLIYPDSTGKAEKSNASESDIVQLRRAGFGIKAHPGNPRVKNRVAAVNGKLCNYRGDRKYWIDPSCRKTITDFEKVEADNEGKPDKSASKGQEGRGLTHISDAAGYMVHYLFPFRRSKAMAK